MCLAAGAAILVGQGAPFAPFPRTDWPLPATHPVRPSAEWTHGYPADASFFPIGVWCQDPKNAERFKDAGFNLYVALWQGPTDEQLARLTEVGMPVICDQNQVGLKHLDDPIIVAWMHGDEPDNAQAINDPATGELKGYGPPVPPADVIAEYEAIRAKDPTRPVLLNLGQGVANQAWIGRGSEGKPEDYDGYVKAADIVSFDVYPVTDRGLPNGGHELWYVPKGVDRLRKLTGNQKIIWNALECTHIGNAAVKPTPHQVRAEAWMSIIHGSTGLIWFVHQFEPRFIEPALLEDPEMLAAVTAINHQIRDLAPALNSPTIPSAVTAKVSDERVPVDVLCKKSDGALYVFAVAMQDAPTKATFTLADGPATGTVEVLGENQKLPVANSAFEDEFGPNEVHLYVVRGG
jgi:hypothetical protein